MKIYRTNVARISQRMVFTYGLGEVLYDIESGDGQFGFTDYRLAGMQYPDDYLRGAWIKWGNEYRQVASYDNVSGKVTVTPGFTTTIISRGTIEIWRNVEPWIGQVAVRNALREVKVYKQIYLDALPVTQSGSSISFKSGQEVIIAVPYTSPYGVSGLFSVGSFILETIATSSVLRGIMKVTYTPSITLEEDVSITLPAGMIADQVLAWREEATIIKSGALTKAFPADIITIHEWVNFFDNPSQDQFIYEYPDKRELRRIDDWKKIDDMTIEIAKPRKGPLIATVMVPYEDEFSVTPSLDYLELDVDEEYIAAKAAKNLFEYLKVTSGNNVMRNQWIDFGLAKAEQVLTERRLAHNMDSRSSAPKGRDIEYILGDTYLGSVL